MKPVFDIKSARIDALSVLLHSTDAAAVRTQLDDKAEQYRRFADMPLLLDVAALTPDAVDLPAVLAAFRSHGFNIAVLRGGEDWQQHARACGLAVGGADTAADVKTPPETETAEEACEREEDAPPPETADKTDTVGQTPPAARETVVIERPVRTGQQVYAEQADLIVLGMVSEGAEVIADGHIHIYAPMRGRALAGAAGNRQARIFIQSMQAELVSVAGIYRTFDQTLPPHLNRRAVQVYFQDGRLAVSALSDGSSEAFR